MCSSDLKEIRQLSPVTLDQLRPCLTVERDVHNCERLTLISTERVLVAFDNERHVARLKRTSLTIEPMRAQAAVNPEKLDEVMRMRIHGATLGDSGHTEMASGAGQAKVEKSKFSHEVNIRHVLSYGLQA